MTIRAAVLIAAVLTTTAPAMAGEVLHGPIPAEFVDAYDGDTITVRAAVWLSTKVETRVRMAGVDTPEMRGKCQGEMDKAAAAREMTIRLASDGVVLMDVQADKYGGRVRARVLSTTGQDIGEALIAAGLGRPYAGERRKGWCEDGGGS